MLDRALPIALAALVMLGCPSAEERAEQAREQAQQALARGEREAALEAIASLERAGGDDPVAIRERALLLIGAGEAPRVAWLLDDAVARFPHAQDLRLLLAETALLVSDPARAEAVAKEIPDTDPAAAHALAIRARAALARGDLPAALEWFERAEQIEPGRPELRAPRVAALLAEGRFDEADRAVEQARAALPSGEAGADLALALHHYRVVEADRRRRSSEQAGDVAAAEAARADLDAALDDLAGFATASPDRLAAWQILVHGLLAAGRADRAAELLTAALAEAPSAPLSVLLAHAKIAQADPAGAEQVLRDLVARDPRAGTLPLTAFLQGRGRSAEALAVIETARGSGPDALFDLVRAELLLETTDLAAARSAIAALADSPQAELLGARLALAEGDSPAAAQRLEKLAPRLDTAATHFWLARALEAEGDRAGAERRYALAVQRKPGDPAALAAVVRLARERGAWREVVAAARELVAYVPTAIDGWEALVTALLGLGDPAQAEAIARRAAERLPRDPAPPLLIARALRAAGRASDAIAVLESARERFGDRGELAAERVLALGAAGRTDEALREADAAAAVERGYAPLEHARAVVLLSAGRIEEGSRAIDAALALDRDDPGPLRTRCHLAAARGLHREALRDCRLYLDRRPGDAAVRFALGTALEAGGDRDAAIETYRRAAADDPGAAAPRNNLALLLHEQGDLDGALAAAQEAYALADDEPQVLDTLGELYLARGLGDRAVAVLEKAHALDPKLPIAQLHLALAYREAGREDDARRLLEDLLGRADASPVHAQARLALAR